MVLRSNEPEVLADAARHGVGIALLPMSFVSNDLAIGSLVQVLAQWTWPERAINALYAPGRRQSPRVRAFLDYLVKTLAQTEVRPDSKRRSA
jgi:DNA-binding transcriptional LysR family regulator